MSIRESSFQKKIIDRLKAMFPGCVVLKNDAGYIQGIPDLLVLYGERWAMLECKRCKSAAHRPNQDYWISRLGEMSYAAFIYPENEEEIFDEIQQAFES